MLISTAEACPDHAAPGSPVADRFTRSCFQAVIIGAINTPCSSDMSLGYGCRSMPRISA
ncbi:hypothetical protein [Streptomyces sp. N2A]|uniref:hypothetical protein n=1 Tax=Streptomyces sp. N2A TaxID=3073936 RepID=UPI0037DA5354